MIYPGPKQKQQKHTWKLAHTKRLLTGPTLCYSHTSLSPSMTSSSVSSRYCIEIVIGARSFDGRTWKPLYI